jgi:phytol kinase
VGDSMASIVGKSMGRHKMKFGIHPNKSFEGMIAGTLSTFISVVLLFVMYPLAGVNSLLILGIGAIAAMTFAFIDMFGRIFTDNITNTLIPGLIIWGILLLFVA